MKLAALDTCVRRLTAQDIPSALILSALAGWNQTAADWRLLLDLHPEGCLGIECAGRVVATTTLICYEDQLAWLGMVLTHPDYRNQGFARRLVERALELASNKNMRSVKLDATRQGRLLYESLGFREEQPVQRWSGAVVRSHAICLPMIGHPDFHLDREAFGVNRSEVLKRLAAERPPCVLADGFAMWRTGSRASYFGPCVAASSATAKLLIAKCLGCGPRRWYWDLLPSNRDAVAMARELGFHLDRTLFRMVKGLDIRGKESMIYAGGGFELG